MTEFSDLLGKLTSRNFSPLFFVLPNEEEDFLSLSLFFFLSFSLLPWARTKLACPPPPVRGLRREMDPAVIGALLAQLTGAGGMGVAQAMSPQRPPPPPPTNQQSSFGFGGANVSTEALLALFSQQANTAAALAALQSGSAAAVPRCVWNWGRESSRFKYLLFAKGSAPRVSGIFSPFWWEFEAVSGGSDATSLLNCARFRDRLGLSRRLSQ